MFRSLSLLIILLFIGCDSLRPKPGPMKIYEIRVVSEMGHEETYEIMSCFEPTVDYGGYDTTIWYNNNPGYTNKYLETPMGWIVTVKEKAHD